MTPRWRAVLQVQRLLRVLLQHHVPLGVLQGAVNLLTGLDDVALAKAEAHGLPSLGLPGQLARELAEQLVGKEPFGARPSLDAWLDSQPFYELMQAYRHANRVVQPDVASAFEAVKAAIRKAAGQ